MNGIKCDTYMYTVEHCSTFNRKEILTHATTWLDLEDFILCKTSQKEKKMRKSRAVIRNADSGSRSWLYHFSVCDSMRMASPPQPSTCEDDDSIFLIVLLGEVNSSGKCKLLWVAVMLLNYP